MIKNNFYIITGGPGSGKSTLLNALKDQGYLCVDEVARQIIQDQTRISGDALHTKNQIKFRDLMLAESIRTYLEVSEVSRPVFFDRGIPDLFGYCRLINSDVPNELEQAVAKYRYNATVFIAPPWEDIYEHDTERKQGWEEAVATYQNICHGYAEANYNIIELPKNSVNDRVQFILQNIGQVQNSTSISFRPLSLSDIPLMHHWFNQPHIQKFYSLRNWTEDEVTAKLKPYINGETPVKGFIICQNGIAIGYVQYYPVKDYPWPNQDLPENIIQDAAGIDFFIGDAGHTGKGLGTLLLKEILDQLIWPNYDYCIVDPDIRNEAMIHCNERVSFKRHKEISTKDALGMPVNLLLMVIKKH